jgi:AcrR family transcriptional regulator
MTADAAGAPTPVPARRRGRPPKAVAGDTKGTLLRAALELFAAHGYEGTSVRAIARAVGLSESVLYAHFDGKRAIFDAVLGELGPLSTLTVLDAVDPKLALADPPGFVRTLVGRVMDEWSASEARQLISLMSQDGLIHDPALTGGIVVAIGKLAGLFGRWIEAGQVSGDAGAPEDLAYALIAPVALARVLWLHNEAKPADIAAARERAARHAELFIRSVFERLPGEKPQYVLIKNGWLFREAQVAGVLYYFQPGAWNAAVHLGEVIGTAFVEPAADEQGRNGDLAEPVHDVPGFQRAGDGEFTRAVHRVVYVIAGLGERPFKAGRPRVHPAHVLAVKAQDGGLVFGAGGKAAVLVLLDRGPGLGGLQGEEFGAIGDPSRHAGRAAAQDQAVQVGRAIQHVLHGEHATPGTAEQMHSVQVEGGADLGQLFDEAAHRP